MRYQLISIMLLSLLLIGIVSAVPNTIDATNINNNNFTLSCSGAVGDTYFKYGTDINKLGIWTVMNTPAGGNVASVETGSPIQPLTTYYFVACDSTGCDSSPHIFSTPALTPLPTSTLGSAMTNMTRSRFNMLYLPANIIIPYGWLFPADQQTSAFTVVVGMIFMFIYIGLWLRTRSVATGVVIGLITSSFILFTNQGLNLGIPVEFQAIAQALLYASLGGILLAFLKK